jgi:hypothetical protein
MSEPTRPPTSTEGNWILGSGVTPGRVQQAKGGLETLRDLLKRGASSTDQPRPAADGLTPYEEHLDRLQELADSALKAVEAAGWKFDPAEGDSKRVREWWGEKKRGKPLTRYSFYVGSFFESEAARHRNETGKPLPKHNSQEVRERIAQKLKLFQFPPEKTDPSRKGPIWETLNNYLRYRREAERRTYRADFRR